MKKQIAHQPIGQEQNVKTEQHQQQRDPVLALVMVALSIGFVCNRFFATAYIMKIIYRFILILLLAVILSSPAISNYSTTEQRQKKKWYEGGTLHQSKIKDWKKATQENKLATCADFVAKAKKAANMDELLTRSVEVRACIDEATRGLKSTDNEKVSEVAALCIVALKY